MELPIDHFRLLGISAASDAQAVLQILQLRLDRAPSDGYSPDTLEARAELLRSSADLLSDSRRRAAYEADLTALASGGTGVIAALDVPSSLEVGALLLLLEADQALECFELAQRQLQPPRAPALGSGREADLTLIAAKAALSGASELQEQRRYEAAAQLLLQGQQLLQRMGQLPHQRQLLSDALEALAPYRVLDLLSRPLTATGDRNEGLRLLAELVERRGGLEGSADPRLSSDEFQTFFKQIRAFLTVQEQVDLFSGWAKASAAADFLASTALSASGFVQRKPDRIAAALSRLQASGQSGTEVLQACLLLLLGKVEQAQTCFASGASAELKAWVAQQSDQPLAQLCAYCRDWLSRDVLPGYRDLEADADLDAYFADRDVQAYIEQLDPAPAAQPAGTATTGLGNPFASLTTSFGLGGLQSPPPEALDPFEDLDGEPDDEELDDEDIAGEPLWANWEWPQLPQWATWEQWQQWERAGLPWPWQRLAAAALGAGVVVAAGALLVRQPWRSPVPLTVQPAAVAPAKPALPAQAPTPKPVASLPLKASEPSDDELKTLLQAWLTAKATVLAGRESSVPLDDLARSQLVERLQGERSSDAARNETQKIEASISSLEVLEKAPSRIVVKATLDYNDSRMGADGAVLGRTEPTTLINRYVFARDGEIWKLVAFGKAT